MHVPGLFIAPSEGRGRGVFSSIDLHPGDLIEICPVIILSPKDARLVDQTALYDYYFIWDEAAGSIALPLGYGMIYNHHSTPNAEAERDWADEVLRIKCIREVQSGCEIFIKYVNNHNNDLLWFKEL